MADRIITKKELRQLVPLSDTHIARLEKAGKFPRRIKFAPCRVGWLESEITKYIAECKAERDQGSRLTP